MVLNATSDWTSIARTGNPPVIEEADKTQMENFVSRDTMLSILADVPTSTDHMCLRYDDDIFTALNSDDFLEGKKILLVDSANKLPGFSVSIDKKTLQLPGLECFHEVKYFGMAVLHESVITFSHENTS
jgi:hypothetical protein